MTVLRIASSVSTPVNQLDLVPGFILPVTGTNLEVCSTVKCSALILGVIDYGCKAFLIHVILHLMLLKRSKIRVCSSKRVHSWLHGFMLRVDQKVPRKI